MWTRLKYPFSRLAARLVESRLSRVWRESRWKLAFGHLALFLLIMGPLALLVDLWRKADMQMFEWLISRGPPIAFNDNHVAVLDLSYPKDSAKPIETFRTEVAQALNELARHSPHSVVLDILYGDSNTNNLAPLQDAIRLLRQRGVNVFGVVAVHQESGSGLDPDWKTHNLMSQIYSHLSGYGHTVVVCARGSKTFWYEPYLTPTLEPVPALPMVLGKAWNQNFSPPQKPVILRYGAPLSKHATAYIRRPVGPDARIALARDQVQHKVVIIGSSEREPSNCSDRKGPELLAWAFSNLISEESGARTILWAQPTVVVTLTVLVSALAALSLFRLTRESAKLGPRSAAVFSCVRVLALLFLVEFGLLRANQLFPQVTLSILGILLATALTWNYRRLAPVGRPLLTEIDPGQYHFFISYSHDDGAWVMKHIYERLRELKTKSGKQAEVFFDREAIFVGDDWRDKLSQAIANTRFFIPIYTQGYFKREMCKWEIQQAVARHRSKKLSILPLVRGSVTVPLAYEDIQYVNVEDPEYYKRLLTAIKRKDSGFGKRPARANPKGTSR